MYESGATRNNEGKLRWSLLPLRALEYVVWNMTMGGFKYEFGNWRLGFPYSVMADSIWSHWKKWWELRETYDEVDGQHHLSACIFGLMGLIEFEETHPEMDDRPHFIQNKVRDVPLNSKPLPAKQKSLRIPITGERTDEKAPPINFVTEVTPENIANLVMRLAKSTGQNPHQVLTALHAKVMPT